MLLTTIFSKGLVTWAGWQYPRPEPSKLVDHFAVEVLRCDRQQQSSDRRIAAVLSGLALTDHLDAVRCDRRAPRRDGRQLDAHATLRRLLQLESARRQARRATLRWSGQWSTNSSRSPNPRQRRSIELSSASSGVGFRARQVEVDLIDLLLGVVEIIEVAGDGGSSLRRRFASQGLEGCAGCDASPESALEFEGIFDDEGVEIVWQIASCCHRGARHDGAGRAGRGALLGVGGMTLGR